MINFDYLWDYFKRKKIVIKIYWKMLGDKSYLNGKDM